MVVRIGTGRLATTVVAVLVLAAPAQAQEERGALAMSKPAIAPVAIDAGADVAASFGTSCTRSGSDTEWCLDAHMFLGLHVAPAFYLTPHWSVGLRGAVAYAGSGPQGDGWSFLWQAEGEGRYHFLDGRRTDLWIGGDAGVAAFSQHVENDGLGPPVTMTATRPIFGLGAGAFFSIADSILLGPELRAFFVPWGTVPALVSRGTQFSDQAGVVLSVTGTVRLGG